MGILGEEDVLILRPEMTRLAYSYMFVTPGEKKIFYCFLSFFYSLKDSVSLVGFLSARVILGISAMVRFHVFLSISRDFPHQSQSTVPDNSSLVNTTDSLPSHCLYWMS